MMKQQRKEDVKVADSKAVKYVSFFFIYVLCCLGTLPATNWMTDQGMRTGMVLTLSCMFGVFWIIIVLVQANADGLLE